MMSDDEWNGEMPHDPIAEPAGPGEPIDSVVIIASDDGRSYQYDGDGRVHHHDEWRLVCVQAVPAATDFFETCHQEIIVAADALCLAVADGTVIASGVIASIGQQGKTLYITVKRPETDRGTSDGE